LFNARKIRYLRCSWWEIAQRVGAKRRNAERSAAFVPTMSRKPAKAARFASDRILAMSADALGVAPAFRLQLYRSSISIPEALAD
jgi:hypothetical protein